MSAKTFEDRLATMDDWEASHAALLADAPDVEGLVKRVNAGLALPIVSVAIADVGRLVDALLSQQARIRALEDQVANLKGHAEDAERWGALVNLWHHATELSLTQDDDGRWSITIIEAVENADGRWTGDEPDTAIDAHRAELADHRSDHPEET